MNACLNFYYHMYGANVGKLQVSVHLQVFRYNYFCSTMGNKKEWDGFKTRAEAGATPMTPLYFKLCQLYLKYISELCKSILIYTVF